MAEIEPIGTDETIDLRGCQFILEMLGANLWESCKDDHEDDLRDEVRRVVGIIDVVVKTMEKSLEALEDADIEKATKRMRENLGKENKEPQPAAKQN